MDGPIKFQGSYLFQKIGIKTQMSHEKNPPTFHEILDG